MSVLYHRSILFSVLGTLLAQPGFAAVSDCNAGQSITNTATISSIAPTDICSPRTPFQRVSFGKMSGLLIAQVSSNIEPSATVGGDLRGPIPTPGSASNTNPNVTGGSDMAAPSAPTPDPSSIRTTTIPTPALGNDPSLRESTIPPPKVGPAENNTASQDAPNLKGLANITSVTASATAMQKPPFDHLRDTELQFVQITLRNDSQQVAIINGDASEASTGSGSAPAVGGRYLVDSAKPGLSKEKVATVVAATLGSAALAGPIVYEMVTPEQHRDRSLGEAIGIDGTRHQVEADRFGVRVLMPGDESVGWMAFSTEAAQAIKSVSIPLSFSRSLIRTECWKCP